MTSVVKTHSLLRRMIFPFYSVYEVVAFVVLEALVLAVSYFVIPEYFIRSLFFGYVGWLIMADSTSPAQLSVKAGKLENVKAFLSDFGFVSSAPNELWTPALPRALRWAYNKVTISKHDDRLVITGPANSLTQLAKAVSQPDGNYGDRYENP